MKDALHTISTTAPTTPSRITIDTPLTRVWLAFVERRINLWLRFGRPLRQLRLDRWRSCAIFAPNAIFCRVRWQANDYGTTCWQILVLQTCIPPDAVQRIAGIEPGARLLLCANGARQVPSVLDRIDAIEALGIDPAAVSPAYWRTLGNRLSATTSLPAYTTERHAAWLAGRDLR